MIAHGSRRRTPGLGAQKRGLLLLTAFPRMPAVNLRHQDLPHRSISCVPYLVWPAAMGVSTSPGRIIAEPSKETSLRTDRLAHFGRRMSLFLQMLVLRGVCSILANPVSTGVCYEQNSNYLSGTRAASRPVLPSGRSRWF